MLPVHTMSTRNGGVGRFGGTDMPPLCPTRRASPAGDEGGAVAGMEPCPRDAPADEGAPSGRERGPPHCATGSPSSVNIHPVEKEHPTELDHSAATTYTTLRDYLADHGPLVDRIGDSRGGFLGIIEDGIPAPFEARSLDPDSLDSAYHRYRINPDAPLPDGWTITSGRAAPGMGYRGGAGQLVIHNENGRRVPVSILIKLGVLGK